VDNRGRRTAVSTMCPRSRQRVVHYQPELRRRTVILTAYRPCKDGVEADARAVGRVSSVRICEAAAKTSWSTEDLPASAEALQSRPRAAKIVLGWLVCAAPPVKSRRRQIVNPTWGLAARVRLARIQTSALGGLRRPVRTSTSWLAGHPSGRGGQLLDHRSQKAHQYEPREPSPRAAEESLKTVRILLKKDGKVPRQRTFWVDRQGVDHYGE
jgi:hypothetical protein